MVEKELLSIKISNAGLGVAERTEKLQNAKEARIKFLRKNNTFHYGSIVMPDPDVSPEVSVALDILTIVH